MDFSCFLLFSKDIGSDSSVTMSAWCFCCYWMDMCEWWWWRWRRWRRGFRRWRWRWRWRWWGSLRCKVRARIPPGVTVGAGTGQWWALGWVAGGMVGWSDRDFGEEPIPASSWVEGPALRGPVAGEREIVRGAFGPEIVVVMLCWALCAPCCWAGGVWEDLGMGEGRCRVFGPLLASCLLFSGKKLNVITKQW